jgi:hypothetical protein
MRRFLIFLGAAALAGSAYSQTAFGTAKVKKLQVTRTTGSPLDGIIDIDNPSGDYLRLFADDGGSDGLRFFSAGGIYAAGLVQGGGVDFGAANSVFLQSGGIGFEGATANAFEGSLTSADVTADRTWTLPDASGTISLLGVPQTWTATQTFASRVYSTGTGGPSGFLGTSGTGHGNDSFFWINSAAGTDAKTWDIAVSGNQQLFRLVNDANSSDTKWLTVTRSGLSVSSIAFGSPVTIASSSTAGLAFTPGDGTGNVMSFYNPTGDELRLKNSSADVAIFGDGGTLSAVRIQGGSVSSAANTVALRSGGLEFEGLTDDANEGLLAAADVTADRTWTLPNVSGTIPVMESTGVCQIASSSEPILQIGGGNNNAIQLVRDSAGGGNAISSGHSGYSLTLIGGAYNAGTDAGASIVLTGGTNGVAADVFIFGKDASESAWPATEYGRWTSSLFSVSTSFKLGSSGASLSTILSATGSLDFTSIAANSEQTQTLTVTGAVTTNTPSVSLGWSAALPDGVVVKAVWVSAANTVSVRVANVTGSSIDPSAITVRATIIQF